MRITCERSTKNCKDGRIKKEYVLSHPLERSAMEILGRYGSVHVMENLPKPLVTLVRSPYLNLRVLLGDTVLEVWYLPDSLESAEKELFAVLADIPD